jgi:hypothetical protein
MMAVIISLIGGLYLIGIWRKQNTRLLTDLPLAFGVSFILHGMNLFILSSMNAGILPNSLEMFKLRTFVIGGSLFPFILVTLNIWLSRFEKYFRHIIMSMIIYWTVVTLIGASSAMIMILVMPILLFVLFGLMFTFAVTWKTGRLKEVHCGLVLVGLLFFFVSQLGKISLLAIGMGFVADIMTVIGTTLMILGLTTPWRERTRKPTSSSQEMYAEQSTSSI